MTNMSQRILDFEAKHNLLDLEHNWLQYWLLVRNDILNKLNGNKSIAPSWKATTDKYLWKKIVKLTVKSFFSTKKEKDLWIIGSPRRTNLDSRFTDTFTIGLKKRLKEEWISYQDYEKIFPIEFRPKDNPSQKILYLEILWYLGSLVYKIRRYNKIDNSDLFEKFAEEFGASINLRKMVNEYYYKFNIMSKLISYKINTIKPKWVIVVTSYSLIHQAIIYSANKAWIETIELQHGTISKNHIAYTFPKAYRSNILPRKIFTFWEFRNKIIHLPDSTKKISIWFPYLESKYKTDIQKNKNDVLVISQRTIWSEMIDIISKTMKQDKNNKYHFHYKLHPGEFDKINEYKKHIENHNNITFYKGETDIYSLLSLCEMQIGCYSTAVYEWYTLWLKTIILDFPQIIHINEFIATSWLIPVRKWKDIFEKLEWEIDYNDQLEIFKHNSINNMIDSIKRICLLERKC